MTNGSHASPVRPAPSIAAPVAMRVLVALGLGLLLIVGLSTASAANTSNRTLRATVYKWSHRIALDARGISVSAARRHPRRMMSKAKEFRLEAIRARRAVVAKRPSSARGRRAKGLALAAFLDYAIVGRRWSLSGRARLAGRKPLASRHARIAREVARRGNRRLVAAAKLLG